MKRKIIKIDEAKCNGCGVCIPDCPEGALQIIDGKARLVSDLFCDGLGACIGTCPQGAISTEEREAEAYNERKVMEENIIPKGESTIKAHLKHLQNHNETVLYNEAIETLKAAGIQVPTTEQISSGGTCHGICPGTMTKAIKPNDNCNPNEQNVPSQLRQWPIELHLLNPDAQYFKNSDLLIAADCTAFAYGNFHQEFLKNKVVAMFCPKLDNSADAYIEKLTAILNRNNIKSVTVVRMEVPCCGGTTAIIQEAVNRTDKNIPLTVKIISLDGKIIND